MRIHKTDASYFIRPARLRPVSAYTEEVTTKKARARDLTERQAETLRTVIRERIEMLIPAEIDRAELLGINQGGLNRFMDRKQGGSFGVALRVAAMLDQDIMDMLAIEHTETRFAIDTEAIEEHAALPLIARAAAFESFTAEQVNYAIAQRKRAGALKTVAKRNARGDKQRHLRAADGRVFCANAAAVRRKHHFYLRLFCVCAYSRSLPTSPRAAPTRRPPPMTLTMTPAEAAELLQRISALTPRPTPPVIIDTVGETVAALQEAS